MEATNANAWKQLEDLKVIRHKTWLLEKAKQQILHNSQMVQNEEELIREYELEREILLEERRRRLQDLQAIQKDIQQIDDLIKMSTLDKEKLMEEIQRIHEEQFIPMKEAIDELRVQKGLSKLPSLQQLQEQQLYLYLENRRRKYLEETLEEESKKQTTPTTRSKRRRKTS